MGGRVQLEPPHTIRTPRILDIDDVVPASGAQGEDVVFSNKEIVHAPGELIVKLRQDRHPFSRVTHAENNDPVPSGGRALAADNRDGAILGHLDIVDRARIDLDLTNDLQVARIRHVPDVRMAFRAPRPP